MSLKWFAHWAIKLYQLANFTLSHDCFGGDTVVALYYEEKHLISDHHFVFLIVGNQGHTWHWSLIQCEGLHYTLFGRMLKYIVNVSIIVINRAGSIKVCLGSSSRAFTVDSASSHELINSQSSPSVEVVSFITRACVHVFEMSTGLRHATPTTAWSSEARSSVIPTLFVPNVWVQSHVESWGALWTQVQTLPTQSCTAGVACLCITHGGFQSEHWGSTYDQKAEIWNPLSLKPLGVNQTRGHARLCV